MSEFDKTNFIGKYYMKESDLKLSIKHMYNIDTIKLAIYTEHKSNMTISAMQGQYELGFSDKDVVNIIQGLTNDDFYKSMPPKHFNFTAWQDVYKPIFNDIELYVKFQIDKRGE